MLTIEKKFPITKTYAYGLSAFVVGYAAIMFVLLTLPQRTAMSSLANLQTSAEVKKDEVKPAGTPASEESSANGANSGVTGTTPVQQPAANTGTIPVVTTPSTTTPPVTETPTTPVVVPEVPVEEPEEPVIPLPDVPIIPGLLQTVDSAVDVNLRVSL